MTRGIGVTMSQADLSMSFRAFYEANYASLFGAMCLVTGNRADAEELVQDAFLKLWERWDRVATMERPVGYLYRAAMNGFRMRHRRAATAARRVSRRIARTPDLDVFEARFEIDRGLAAITPRQRAALVLTELLELTSTEAADALGVKPATVRKLAQQGREGLRRTIGDPDA